MPTAGIVIPKDEFIKRMRSRIGTGIYGVIGAMENFGADVNKMSPIECNSFLTANKIKINKTELENLFDHFSGGAGFVDIAAFLTVVLEDMSGDDPVFYSTDTPKSPHTAHLALSGVSHIEFGEQYKAFPQHWGQPPNAQLKGHNGIMRELPGNYGKGNAPMANWVKANLEKDSISKTTTRGMKPYPYGNYSL